MLSVVSTRLIHHAASLFLFVLQPSSSKRELVTVDDSSSDEETEEEVEEKLEFDSMHRDVDEGNPADDGQSSEFPPQGGGVDGRKDGDAKTEVRDLVGIKEAILHCWVLFVRGKDVTALVRGGIFEKLYVLPLARVNWEYLDSVYLCIIG